MEVGGEDDEEEARRLSREEFASACCHGGAKMAVLGLGKREINQHFTIRNAKLISLVLVVLLIIFHTASRYFGGKLFTRRSGIGTLGTC